MVDGQVGFHRPENVRRMEVSKNNTIVNPLNKTKVEKFPDLHAEQQQRLLEIQQSKKAQRRALEKARKEEEKRKLKEKEELSYDRVFNADSMTSNADIQGSADNSAAQAYEDDFF
mmetsp:Transcript_823/g.1281  ORF Transcript_823/g.1281 Transcript_823/m.1281 type:complete len:115 (+) Transcript_823:388-732(+)